jgi:hypothetical protein
MKRILAIGYRLCRWPALIVAVLVGAGYLSNLLSAPACEQHVLLQMALRGNNRVQTFVCDHDPDREITVKRMTEIGAKVTVVPYEQLKFPVVTVCRARSIAPFLLKIRYAVVVGDTCGAEKDVDIVSVFGIRVYTRQTMVRQF